MEKLGKSVPPQFRKEGVWTPQLGMYLLWFMYLQISPSYELARSYRAGLLEKNELKSLPADFDMVLSFYGDLGDVWNPEFVDWWQGRGIQNFGYQGGKPTVRHIATLQRNRERKGHYLEQVNSYLDERWENEGQQNTLLVAIPANLSKAKILNKISQFLDGLNPEMKHLKAASPRYKLHGKKHDEASLIRYLEAVKFRAVYPDKPNWEIGSMAKLSPTYSARLATADAEKSDLADDKIALKILTSRAIQRGRAIAENAARGVFPSYAPLPQDIRDSVSACFSEDRVRTLVLRREKALQTRGNA